MPGDIGADLREALVGDGLYVVFQPEFDLETSAITAVEALARWRHPRLGEVDPGEFVALAEESDLIIELGSWVLEAALTEYAVWVAQLPDLDVTLRLNVAVAQLAQPDFADVFGAALTRHVVGAEQVCLEITESSPRRSDAAALAESVRGLRALGAEVAIDDLAHGYSTLGMLRTYPVDVVKLDRGLVAGVDTDARAATIVAALIRLADELGVTVVAEGIETAGERDTVRRLGCRRGQGYLLSMPLAGAELMRLLAEQGRRRRR